MSHVLDRGRWTAPLVLLTLLAAGTARPAAATPAPASLAVTAAVPAAPTAEACYKEMIAYVTAAGEFFAAVGAYNEAVDNGTGSDVEQAAKDMDDAADHLVWMGILLVVCLIQLM